MGRPDDLNKKYSLWFKQRNWLIERIKNPGFPLLQDSEDECTYSIKYSRELERWLVEIDGEEYAKGTTFEQAWNLMYSLAEYKIPEGTADEEIMGQQEELAEAAGMEVMEKNGKEDS